MPWTEEQKLNYLVNLRWTITPDRSPEGDRLLRIAELPSFVVGGGSVEEITTNFWEALESTLRAYLHFGDNVTLPKGVDLPWDAHNAPSEPAAGVVFTEGGARQVQGTGATATQADDILQPA